jgi:hypothetical protein
MATDSETPEVEVMPSRRDAVLEQVMRARNAMLAENGIDIESPSTDGATADEAPASEPGPEQEKTADPVETQEGADEAFAISSDEGEAGEDPVAPDSDPAEPALAQESYTIVVDGEERKVPLKELVDNYQIRSAAQKRLDEAAGTLQRVNVLDAELRARQAGAAAQEPQDSGAAEPQKDPLAGLDLADVVRAIQYGSEDEGAEKLRGLITKLGSGSGQPAVDQSEITRQVLGVVEANQARQRFDQDFADIAADPYLRQLTGQIADRYQAQAIQDSQRGGAMPSAWDILSTAAGEVRTWTQRFSKDPSDSTEEPPRAPEGSTPDVSVSKDRAGRKKAAMQPPAPRASQSLTPSAATPGPRTEDDVIKQRQRDIADVIKGRQVA